MELQGGITLDDKVDIFDKILNKIATLVKYFLGILLGIMLAVALFTVFTRYFLGKSFAWSEELTRYLIIWISFLGAAVGYKEEGLVFFDMIVNIVKGKNKKNLLLFICIKTNKYRITNFNGYTILSHSIRNRTFNYIWN